MEVGLTIGIWGKQKCGGGEENGDNYSEIFLKENRANAILFPCGLSVLHFTHS